MVAFYRNRGQLAQFLDQSSVQGGVDYHLHSTFSDGSKTPCEVVANVIENGLRAFALTDHDTMAGVGEVVDVLDRMCSPDRKQNDGELDGDLNDSPPLFIPGVEFSVMLDDREIHVLGYFSEPNPPSIAAFMEDQAKNRDRRNKAMIEKLQSFGYDIREDDLFQYGGDGTLPGRVHVALWLVDRGAFRSVTSAFKELLGVGKPAFVKKSRLSVEEACDEIDRAGGLSVIAHPQQYGWTDNPSHSSTLTALRERLKRLMDFGISGVECFHGKASPEEQRLLAKVATELGLIRTAGSDCHGRTDHHAPMYDSQTSFAHLI